MHGCECRCIRWLARSAAAAANANTRRSRSRSSSGQRMFDDRINIMDRMIPAEWEPCERNVDENFSKLVIDVQTVISSVVQRLSQMKLDDREVVDEYEQRMQQIQLPEMESLCHEIRSAGEKLKSRVNEALNQLMTAITTSVSSEMRRVMRSVVDDVLKTMSENGRKKMCAGISEDHCDILIRRHTDQINHRLRRINRYVYQLNQQNSLLTFLEQQLGLDLETDDRNRKMQQLLHSALWSGPLPDHSSGAFPEFSFTGEEVEILCSPVAGQRESVTHSATKDKTFAEILTDGDNPPKKWETKSPSERKSCCRKLNE